MGGRAEAERLGARQTRCRRGGRKVEGERRRGRETEGRRDGKAKRQGGNGRGGRGGGAERQGGGRAERQRGERERRNRKGRRGGEAEGRRGGRAGGGEAERRRGGSGRRGGEAERRRGGGDETRTAILAGGEVWHGSWWGEGGRATRPSQKGSPSPHPAGWVLLSLRDNYHYLPATAKGGVPFPKGRGQRG